MADPIGFIGLGIMGKPMARNLIKKGHHLVLYNRSDGALRDLQGDNVIAAASPAEVARRCAVVLLMLPDGPDVERVIGGDDALLETVRPNSLVIDMSSIEPSFSTRLARRLSEAGAGYVDAPVSGGESGAVAGTLSIMCGGSEADVERARPILLDMGKSVVRIGDVGAGQAAKLVNQVLVALHLQAAAEALAFASQLGLDGTTLLSAIRDGLAGSNVLNAKWSKMLSQEFTPGFRVHLHLKDLNNAIRAANEHNADLPWTRFVQQQFQFLVDAGLGELDHSSLVRSHNAGNSASDDY